MQPIIAISRYELSAYTSFRDMYEKLDILRVKVKQATGYRPDNQHYYFYDVGGVLCLPFILTNTVNNIAISLYAWTGSQYLFHYEDWELFKKMLPNILDKVSKGYLWCDVCNKWKKDYSFQSYSYSGVVCKKCYNPKKHLPPDTKGD